VFAAAVGAGGGVAAVKAAAAGFPLDGPGMAESASPGTMVERIGGFSGSRHHGRRRGIVVAGIHAGCGVL
jgi:hypothetical protein